jgi:hypothetical protein
MDPKLFDEIENTLDLYIHEDPEHPDMKIFSASAGFNPVDVAEVIKTSQLLDLKDFQKEILLSSFVKKENHPEEAQQPIEKISISEWSGKRRREIRKDFMSCSLSVQDYLEANPNISSSLLRNILPIEVWNERYDRKRPDRDWENLLKVFKEDLPGISVQQFCAEQGIPIKTFQKHCPEDLYNERLEKKRRTIDWKKEVEDMKASDICLEDWAYQNKLSLPIFREKCGDEVVKRYDRHGRRAAAFDPNISLKENAEKLGLSIPGLSAWVNSKLAAIDPEKFKAFKMDAKDYQIVELQEKVTSLETEKASLLNRIQHLENILANKNSYIEQMRTSHAQKAAKFSSAKKAIEEALKAL